MLKFFRHIRKSILMENKTGKYFKYAIGEIVLVVIGILIALQVNSWNEKRKEQIKSNIFLSSLINDLKSDLVQLDSIFRFRLKREQDGILIYKEMDEASVDNKPIIDSLYAIVQDRNPTFFPTIGAYDGAKNSGTFENIKNEELKKRIRTLYERFYDRLIYNGEELDKRKEIIALNRHRFFDERNKKIISLEAIHDREFYAQLEFLLFKNKVYRELLEHNLIEIKSTLNQIESELNQNKQ